MTELFKQGWKAQCAGTFNLSLYETAKEQGSQIAIFHLNCIYRYGQHVSQNRSLTIDWDHFILTESDFNELLTSYLEQADNKEIQHNLGVLFYTVKKYEDAVLWFQKASSDYAPSQSFLGFLYLEGCGVEKNDNKAYELILKAAEQGYDYSQYYIGYLYENGISHFKKDYTQAYKWYLLAANNYKDARYRIGSFLSLRSGVECNLEEARKWYLLADTEQALLSSGYFR